MQIIKDLLCGIVVVGSFLTFLSCDTVRTADYFPLEEGDTWTYGEPGTDGMSAQQADGMTMTLTVTGTEMINGLEATKVESDDGSYELWTLDDDGLTLHKLFFAEGDGGEEHLFNPPLNILPAEITLGTSYPFESTLTIITSEGADVAGSESGFAPSADYDFRGRYRVGNLYFNVKIGEGNYKDSLRLTRFQEIGFQNPRIEEPLLRLSVLEHDASKVKGYLSPGIGRTKLKGFDCGDLQIGPTWTYGLSSGVIGGIPYPLTETTTTTSLLFSEPVIVTNQLTFSITHGFGVDSLPQFFDDDLEIEEQGGGNLDFEITNTKSWLRCNPSFGKSPLTVNLIFNGNANFFPDENGKWEDEDIITITGSDPDTGLEADPVEVLARITIEF